VIITLIMGPTIALTTFRLPPQVRRLVFGLREVARGLRSRKIKYVILAPDVESSPALESEIQEIMTGEGGQGGGGW
jgi:hypothetical protein